MEFFLDHHLGKGENCIVCKGVWRGTPVAIKRTELTKINYKEQKEQDWQKLQHDNVVKFIHAESDDSFR
jgi:hypothetical protein